LGNVTRVKRPQKAIFDCGGQGWRIICSKCRFALLLSVYLLVLVSGAFGQQAFKTQHTIHHYREEMQLQKMNQRIKSTPPKEFMKYYSFSPDPRQETLAPGLAAKVDAGLYKVCHLLPKCPGNWPLLHIYLLDNSEEVRQRLMVFSPFYGSRIDHSPSQGFFLSSGNSIFLSLEDLRTGILAHEMTHFILCQYRPIPPGELQEKWAQYVETQF